MKLRDLQNAVYAHCLEKPEDAPAIVASCEAGIHQAFNLATQRAADMESALAQALAKSLPVKKKNEHIRQWLEKWRGKTSLRWDWWLDGRGE